MPCREEITLFSNIGDDNAQACEKVSLLMDKTVLFFSFTYFNIFDTVAEHILKQKKRSDSPRKETVA